MADSINPTVVLQLIVGDIDACNKLLALSKREQEALRERDMDALAQIIEEKIPHITRLEQSAEIRTQWAAAQPQEEAEHAWSKLIDEAQSKELKEAWNTLQKVLTECKVSNEVNGKMLARNRKVFGRLLDIIRGQNSANNLYTANGAASGGIRKHIVGKA